MVCLRILPRSQSLCTGQLILAIWYQRSAVSWKEKVLFLVSRIESRMRQACLAGFEAAGASAVSAKQGVRACYFCPPFVELLFVFFLIRECNYKTFNSLRIRIHWRLHCYDGSVWRSQSNSCKHFIMTHGFSTVIGSRG
jgi:hypothetical protein